MDIPRRGHDFCFLLPGSRRRTLYSYNYAILLSVHVCRLYSWVASSPTLAQFNCRGSFGPRSGGGDPSYLAVWLRGRAHSDWVSEWVEGHTQKMTRTTCSWCMSSSVHKQFLGVLYFAFKSLLLLLFYGLLRGTISIYGKLYFLHSNKIYIMHLSLSIFLLHDQNALYAAATAFLALSTNSGIAVESMVGVGGWWWLYVMRMTSTVYSANCNRVTIIFLTLFLSLCPSAIYRPLCLCVGVYFLRI